MALFFAVAVIAATPDIVPRADGEGALGTSAKSWATAAIDDLTTLAQTGSYTEANSNAAITVSTTIMSYDIDTTAAAVTATLPEASTVLGKFFYFYVSTDGGNNFILDTDGTDMFSGSNSNRVTFADEGDACIVQSVGDNRYAIFSNVGGALSAQ